VFEQKLTHLQRCCKIDINLNNILPQKGVALKFKATPFVFFLLLKLQILNYKQLKFYCTLGR